MKHTDNYPFVCHSQPLICLRASHNYPIVGLFIPLVVTSRFSRGFTLIELVVTLAIVAMLAGLAAPAVVTLIQNQRLSSQANELLGDLAFARSEAIKRATFVTICKTSDPNAAAPTCNGTAATPWTTGRLIFIDNVNGGSAAPPGNGILVAGEHILRIRQALDGASNTLLGDGGTANRITFSPNGASNNLTGEPQLTFCDKRGDAFGLAVAISNLGRARALERGKNANGTTITACP